MGMNKFIYLENKNSPKASMEESHIYIIKVMQDSILLSKVSPNYEVSVIPFRKKKLIIKLFKRVEQQH